MDKLQQIEIDADWSDDQLDAASFVVGIFIEMDLEARRSASISKSLKKEDSNDNN